MTTTNNGTARALGVWIDHRSARIIDVTDADAAPSVREIESDAEEVRKTVTGHVGNLPPKGGHHSFGSAEPKHAENRRIKQLKQFYERVAKPLSGADRIVIMGPGTARTEFAKHLRANASGVAKKIERVEAVGARLTEKEIVARARELLDREPPRQVFGA